MAEKNNGLETVRYANSVYEVLKKGERTWRLRSIKDPKLVISCKSNSPLLKKIEEGQ